MAGDIGVGRNLIDKSGMRGTVVPTGGIVLLKRKKVPSLVVLFASDVVVDGGLMSCLSIAQNSS